MHMQAGTRQCSRRCSACQSCTSVWRRGCLLAWPRMLCPPAHELSRCVCRQRISDATLHVIMSYRDAASCSMDRRCYSMLAGKQHWQEHPAKSRQLNSG